MLDSLLLHRWHFGFTVTYHYLFPQLSMGLAMIVFMLKTMGYRGNETANIAARFLSKILGLTFLMGVVTGIPLEFQFGTNWSRFSEAAGGVIGQTLAMEGMFAFFLESSFLYVLIFAEKKVSAFVHWLASLLVFFGTWLSGYFIICTNAWMQHPVGHVIDEQGHIHLESLSTFFFNPWALIQWLHNQNGSVITASFVCLGIGAFYLLRHRDTASIRLIMKIALITGTISSIAAAFPTGDLQAKLVAKYKPASFAAMEGLFETEEQVEIVLIGQPNVAERRLDNKVAVPGVLSFLTYNRWDAEIKGLNEFPEDEWPDNIELTYYSYRIMVGLGSFFILLTLIASGYALRKKLWNARGVLWALMIAMPFPFIANTAGWMTAEVGRQPWLIYGLMKTAEGHSQHVSSGNTLFSLLGFMGMYALLSLIYFALLLKIIAKGPEGSETPIQEGIGSWN